MAPAATRNDSHGAASATAEPASRARAKRDDEQTGDDEQHRAAERDEGKHRGKDLDGFDVHGHQVWGVIAAPDRTTIASPTIGEGRRPGPHR